MSQVLSDHFVREAAEYLDELEALLRRAEVPDAERIFRLARGVRGSAQVAQADGIAQVAGRLEGAARFLLEGRIPWSEEIRERALRTVDDLRALLDAFAGEWGDAADHRVRDALARWGGFAEVTRAAPATGEGVAVFSFVRTELGGVVEVLESAVARLRERPTDPAPVEAVLGRIRALRGVAGSAPLAPVLEVLDGVDELLRAAATNAIPLAGDRLAALEVAHEALADALGALRQDRAPVAGAALRRFRDLRDSLRDDPDADAEIVPVHTLLAGEGGAIVSSPAAPAGAVSPHAAAAFVRERALPLLDRSEALVSAAGSGDGAAVARRVEESLASIDDLARLFGVDPVVAAVGVARQALREAGSSNERRGAIVRLRERIDGPPAAEEGLAPVGGRSAPSPPPAEDGEGEVVEIDTLLLRGQRALEEAIGLRGDLERLVAAQGGATPELQARMEELWELMALARTPG